MSFGPLHLDLFASLWGPLDPFEFVVAASVRGLLVFLCIACGCSCQAPYEVLNTKAGTVESLN